MTYHPSCEKPSPALVRRLWSLGVPVAVASLLLLGSTTAVDAQNVVVLPVADCNSTFLEDGSQIFWTSSFSTDDYQFDQMRRSGRIGLGTGDLAQVSVQWLIEGSDAKGSPAGVTLRGAGFSPGGVRAALIFEGTAGSFPALGSVDCFGGATPVGVSTFFLQFTQLKLTGGGVAKGTSHLRVEVLLDDDRVSLGTNVHVATGVDPDE